jgi:hypothetical protein
MLVVLLVPQAASAQSAFCQQYPDSPLCLPGGGSGGEDDDGNAGVNAGDGFGVGTVGSGDASGNLPFTGYPITDLVLLLVAMLLAGCLLRAYLAARDRRHARADHVPHS